MKPNWVLQTLSPRLPPSPSGAKDFDLVEDRRNNPLKYDATMLDIGSDKQVFVDDLVIESVENVCRTWHQPVRASNSPVITEDKPWEHIVYFTFNGSQVIRD